MSNRAPLITITSGLSAALVLLALYGIFTVHTFSSVAGDVVKATTTEPVAFARVVSEPLTEAVQLEVAEPATAARAVEASVQTTETVEPEAPVQEPVSEPWTAEMTTAGIAASDQPIVRALVFSGYDWNVMSCQCGRGVRALISPESRFTYLNQYVQRTHGSWAGAQAKAAQGTW